MESTIRLPPGGHRRRRPSMRRHGPRRAMPAMSSRRRSAASPDMRIGSGTGERLHPRYRSFSSAENDAAFFQDDFTLTTKLTFSLGARAGRWSAWLTPPCDTTCRPRFHVATAQAIEPRVGIAWDVTGRSDLTLKAHWGRYHQG